MGDIADSWDFEEGSYNLQELCYKHPPPVIVQSVQTENIANPGTTDLTEPLLLYRQRNINKVTAKIVHREIYKEVGPPLLIPEDYKGWFAVLEKKQIKLGTLRNDVNEFKLVEHLSKSDTLSFLIGGTEQVNALQVATFSDGKYQHQERTLFPGEVLRKGKIYIGETKRKSGLFRRPKIKHVHYLLCTDECDREILLPFTQQGLFYTLTTENGRMACPVLQMKDILDKRYLPATVKLLFGRMPPVASDFSGLLRLEQSHFERSVIACTTQTNHFIELPLISSSQYRIVKMNDSVVSSDNYKNAFSVCNEKVHLFMRGIKPSKTSLLDEEESNDDRPPDPHILRKRNRIDVESDENRESGYIEMRDSMEFTGDSDYIDMDDEDVYTDDMDYVLPNYRRKPSLDFFTLHRNNNSRHLVKHQSFNTPPPTTPPPPPPACGVSTLGYLDLDGFSQDDSRYFGSESSDRVKKMYTDQIYDIPRIPQRSASEGVDMYSKHILQNFKSEENQGDAIEYENFSILREVVPKPCGSVKNPQQIPIEPIIYDSPQNKEFRSRPTFYSDTEIQCSENKDFEFFDEANKIQKQTISNELAHIEQDKLINKTDKKAKDHEDTQLKSSMSFIIQATEASQDGIIEQNSNVKNSMDILSDNGEYDNSIGMLRKHGVQDNKVTSLHGPVKQDYNTTEVAILKSFDSNNIVTTTASDTLKQVDSQENVKTHVLDPSNPEDSEEIINPDSSEQINSYEESNSISLVSKTLANGEFVSDCVPPPQVCGLLLDMPPPKVCGLSNEMSKIENNRTDMVHKEQNRQDYSNTKPVEHRENDESIIDTIYDNSSSKITNIANANTVNSFTKEILFSQAEYIATVSSANNGIHENLCSEVTNIANVDAANDGMEEPSFSEVTNIAYVGTANDGREEPSFSEVTNIANDRMVAHTFSEVTKIANVDSANDRMEEPSFSEVTNIANVDSANDGMDEASFSEVTNTAIVDSANDRMEEAFFSEVTNTCTANVDSANDGMEEPSFSEATNIANVDSTNDGMEEASFSDVKNMATVGSANNSMGKAFFSEVTNIANVDSANDGMEEPSFSEVTNIANVDFANDALKENYDPMITNISNESSESNDIDENPVSKKTNSEINHSVMKLLGNTGEENAIFDASGDTLIDKDHKDSENACALCDFRKFDHIEIENILSVTESLDKRDDESADNDKEISESKRLSYNASPNSKEQISDSINKEEYFTNVEKINDDLSMKSFCVHKELKTYHAISTKSQELKDSDRVINSKLNVQHVFNCETKSDNESIDELIVSSACGTPSTERLGTNIATQENSDIILPESLISLKQDKTVVQDISQSGSNEQITDECTSSDSKYDDDIMNEDDKLSSLSTDDIVQSFRKLGIRKNVIETVKKSSLKGVNLRDLNKLEEIIPGISGIDKRKISMYLQGMMQSSYSIDKNSKDDST